MATILTSSIQDTFALSITSVVEAPVLYKDVSNHVMSKDSSLPVSFPLLSPISILYDIGAGRATIGGTYISTAPENPIVGLGGTTFTELWI